MQSTRRVLWRAHSNIDQHCDLRPSRTIRDGKDFYKYRNRLTSHSPYEIAEGIVSIFTGNVTANKAKAYATCSTGKLAAVAYHSAEMDLFYMSRKSLRIRIGSGLLTNDNPASTRKRRRIVGVFTLGT